MGGKSKKKYIVLILGDSNNSGNKDREKRSTKANPWRRGLFYVATGHFSARVMDVSLLRGWRQQHDSRNMALDILYILYGALSLMLPRGSENHWCFNTENIVVVWTPLKKKKSKVKKPNLIRWSRYNAGEIIKREHSDFFEAVSTQCRRFGFTVPIMASSAVSKMFSFTHSHSERNFV